MPCHVLNIPQQLTNASEVRVAGNEKSPFRCITDACARLSTLSPREWEVARLIAAGDQSKVIAFKLGISVKTIEVHRERVMTKTGCGNLVEFGRLWEAALAEAAGTIAGNLIGFMVALPVYEVAHA